MKRLIRSTTLMWIVPLFLVAFPAFCQLTTADIVGTVTDQAGAVVSDATITVENANTHDRRTVQSSSSGDFAVTLLPPGQYSVKVEAKGFKVTNIPSLTLVAGDHARADAKLQVGEVTQTVEVTATTPALQTDSATVRDTVSAQSVQDLPLNGRNFVQLVTTAPGAAPGPANSILSGTRPDERRQTANITANGQNERFNNQLVDGMDNNEREQGTILFRPSIDSIQEVHVDVNTYTSETGRTGGAVVNLMTKSGSNQFHGGVYEFLRNDKLNANDFFNNSAGTPRPEYRQNQFGGSIGGPIQKDKTFFFFDTEELRIIQGQPTGLPATATAYELAHPGDFSDVGGPVIAPSRIDPVALKYLALLPAANVPGGTPSANYSANVQKQYYSRTIDARVDHRFSERDTVFGRFSYNPTTNIYPTLYPVINGIYPGNGIFPGNSNATAQSYMLDWVHLFSPTVVMELKGGFTRLNLATYPSNQGSNLSTKFGIPNADVNPLISGLMPVVINGYEGTGSDNSLGDSRFVPILDINNVFQEEGTISWTHGPHSVKFGAGLIRRQLNYFQNTAGLGYFQFSALTAGSPPNSLANFLLGVPTTITRQANFYYQYFRTWEPHYYAQDDWRVNRWLTLNLGVRWDYFGQLASAVGQRSNWQIDKNQFCISDTGCVQPYWKAYAPRIGFAMNPGKGLVIRGGFGISYFPQDYAAGSVNLSNPPFTSTNFTCQPAVVGGIACPAGIGTLSQGPPLAVPASITNPVGSLNSHSDYYPPSSIIQYNFTVQKQLGANVFTATYVGELGRHMDYPWNANLPVPSGTSVQPTFVRIRTLPNVQGITLYDATGGSAYNGLQLVFERRYHNGLAASANYTFARALTNIIDNIGTAGQVVNNRHYDWGNSDIGIKHRVSVRVNYELPFGKNASGFKKTAIGGWQVNSIAFWQTGLPFTVYDNQNLINLPNTTSDRPNAVSGQSYYASTPTLTNWINLSAFQQQAIGHPGNEGHNQLFGPHLRSVDFSIFKDFQIREQLKLSFRAESFNISNTENFSTPGSSISQWTGTGPTAIPTHAGTFGQITASNIGQQPRVFQFALKLTF